MSLSSVLHRLSGLERELERHGVSEETIVGEEQRAVMAMLEDAELDQLCALLEERDAGMLSEAGRVRVGRLSAVAVARWERAGRPEKEAAYHLHIEGRRARRRAQEAAEQEEAVVEPMGVAECHRVLVRSVREPWERPVAVALGFDALAQPVEIPKPMEPAPARVEEGALLPAAATSPPPPEPVAHEVVASANTSFAEPRLTPEPVEARRALRSPPAPPVRDEEEERFAVFAEGFDPPNPLHPYDWRF